MAKTTKKLIALLLAIVMITTLVSPSNYNWSNAAETRGGDNYATETDALAMLADAAITAAWKTTLLEPLYRMVQLRYMEPHVRTGRRMHHFRLTQMILQKQLGMLGFCLILYFQRSLLRI